MRLVGLTSAPYQPALHPAIPPAPLIPALYPVRMPLDRVRQLLIDYLERVENVAARPEWCNSVISNCTTILFYHRHHQVPWLVKPAIFLNGLSARAMYQHTGLKKATTGHQFFLLSECD